MKTIAIVVPVFNEQESLEELYIKLKESTSSLKNYTFKYFFVDDGSRDGTSAIIRSLSKEDPRVKFIRFAHNCGSHAALSAGLIHCEADAAIVMAADLQDPPELIPSLLEKWKDGAKIVWAARDKREGENFLIKFCAKVYYMLMNILTNVKVPPEGADVFLIDKAAVDAFKTVPEKHTSALLAIAWLGFKQETITYDKQPRYKGRSKWTFGKRLKLFLDSIFAFSDFPIKAIGLIGLVLLLVGLFVNISLVVKWFTGQYIRVDMFLWGGDMLVASIQVLILWVLGEYMYRTFDEARRRPKYIIEEKVL